MLCVQHVVVPAAVEVRKCQFQRGVARNQGLPLTPDPGDSVEPDQEEEFHPAFALQLSIASYVCWLMLLLNKTFVYVLICRLHLNFQWP